LFFAGVTTVIPLKPAIKIEMKYLDKIPIPTDPPVGPTHSLGFGKLFDLARSCALRFGIVFRVFDLN
jgi:hypothetical protein